MENNENMEARIKWVKENLYSKYHPFEVKNENGKLVIYGDVLIPYMLEELEYKIDEVHGNISTDNVVDQFINGNLKSLKNFPDIVYGDCIVRMNSGLTTLENSPKRINGDFNCSNCGLTNVKGMPKYIAGNFIAYNNNISDLTQINENYIIGMIDMEFNPCENEVIKFTAKNKSL